MYTRFSTRAYILVPSEAGFSVPLFAFSTTCASGYISSVDRTSWNTPPLRCLTRANGASARPWQLLHGARLLTDEALLVPGVGPHVVAVLFPESGGGFTYGNSNAAPQESAQGPWRPWRLRVKNLECRARRRAQCLARDGPGLAVKTMVEESTMASAISVNTSV